MFRIEHLLLHRHPQLGNIHLKFTETGELKAVSKPYTSVIIGPNGTGKSYILRTVAEIFRQFKRYQDNGEKNLSLPFELHLSYMNDGDRYEIITRQFKSDEKTGRRQYLYYKNRREVLLFPTADVDENAHKPFEITIEELVFPSKLLVNSIIPTDRFVWQESKPTDFYQYLGARSTSSTTSTKTTSRRTVKHLFNAAMLKSGFKKNLTELLQFLDFGDSFEVHYTTKINKLFFSGNLELKDFRQYFENWWDPEFKFTTRKKDNPLWSIPYYNNNFRERPSEIDELIIYLNTVTQSESVLHHIKNSSSKKFSVNLFNASVTERELELISHLESLDILSLDGIKIIKAGSDLSIGEVSSGEYHLLVSMISMLANIEENSVVLIDEPEISLHPNWQMKYISFLKKVFGNFSSCHFILTTHSHFLLSDLEGVSSSVITLTRDPEKGLSAELLEGLDTYSWSAEDILYNVFHVSSTWNPYMEADLTELLGRISKGERNATLLQPIVDKLERLPQRPHDPLQTIIEDAKAYISQL